MRNYINDFETYLKQNKRASQNTVVSYMRDIKRFSNFCIENGIKDLAKSTPKAINSYISDLSEDGKSSATITRSIASLKAFFLYLLSDKVISDNPMSGVKTVKKTKKLPHILTNKEIDLFLSQPKCDSAKGYRDKAMLELLYATGIRVSELISLDVEDINIELGFIKCGTDANERFIPVYPAALKAVSEYLNEARPLLLSGLSGSSLFLNLNGERMTRQGFWKIIKHYKETSKIKSEITPHTLRHSFALHLLENGADINDIKEMMGHSDISSMQVYAKLIKNNLKKSYIKFHPRA